LLKAWQSVPTDLTDDEIRQALLDLASDPDTDLETRFHIQSELAELYAQAGAFAHMHTDANVLKIGPDFLVTGAMRAILAKCFEEEKLPVPVGPKQLAQRHPPTPIRQFPFFAYFRQNSDHHTNGHEPAQTATNGASSAQPGVAQATTNWNPHLARLRLRQTYGDGARTPITPTEVPHARQTND
jgi:hypothetical protein